jgi:hypothetical protein
MKRDPTLPVGTLPLDAVRKLQMAGRVGTPGSLVRRSAIDRAYRYVEERYPQYLHPSYNQQED